MWASAASFGARARLLVAGREAGRAAPWAAQASLALAAAGAAAYALSSRERRRVQAAPSAWSPLARSCYAACEGPAQRAGSAAPGPSSPVALITGSSSGIGRAIAERLAAEGYRVVVNSNASVEAGTAVAKSLPGAVYIQGDCSQSSGCEALVEKVVEKLGRLDVLVCNAGVGKVIPHGRLDLIDEEYVQKIFSLNCFGPLWLSRAAMPHLQKAPEGCIVMISSAAGARPMGSSIPYSMTRAAMNQLTKLLAKSHGPVRVNAVAPGLIRTRITGGSEWEAMYAAVEEKAPMQRVGEPDDMVDAVLCCLRSKYMTGQVIGVDGGSALVF